MDRPRDLTIAHVLPSFGLGGQERLALRLGQKQQSIGHRVVAFSLTAPPDGPLTSEFRAAGIEPCHVPKQGRGLDLGLPARLAVQFRRQGVTVVHAHNPQSLIYAALAGKAVDAAVVYTCHGENSLSSGRLWLTRLASLFVDAYVGVSPRIAARALRHHECSESKLRIIENGVDLSTFHPDSEARRALRAELDLPPQAWLVGTVGRLVRAKDPEVLLRAAAPLLGPEAGLVFVGEGPLHSSLRALAAEHPNGRWVRFLGARQDVARLLAGFDIFALSSCTEGLPLALLEAMATSLPIVATSVGGVPDVLCDGVSGKLVPKADPAALRAALVQLRDHPAEAARLGLRAREESQRFSSIIMAQRYLDLYHSCRGS